MGNVVWDACKGLGRSSLLSCVCGLLICVEAVAFCGIWVACRCLVFSFVFLHKAVVSKDLGLVFVESVVVVWFGWILGLCFPASLDDVFRSSTRSRWPRIQRNNNNHGSIPKVCRARDR